MIARKHGRIILVWRDVRKYLIQPLGKAGSAVRSDQVILFCPAGQEICPAGQGQRFYNLYGPLNYDKPLLERAYLRALPPGRKTVM